MDSNHENHFAELVSQYVAAARSSAQATTSQSVSYPQYDPRDLRTYYEAHNQQLHDTTNGTNLAQNYHSAYNQYGQAYPQPYNAHHYQPVTHHLTSVDENPNRIPFDRKRERSMGYKNTVSKRQSSRSAQNASRTQKPKPQDVNIIICDVCKVSCAGELPYKEHLNGKQHKKKETALKKVESSKPLYNTSTSPPKKTNQILNSTSSIPSNDNSVFIRCTVCSITCCGKESYESHLRGAKHKKVVSLNGKLGSSSSASSTLQATKKSPSSSNNHSSHQSSLKVLGAPLINFVKGGRLHTIDNTIVEIPETEENKDDKDRENDRIHTDSREPESEGTASQPGPSLSNTSNELVIDTDEKDDSRRDVSSSKSESEPEVYAEKGESQMEVLSINSESSPRKYIGEEYVKEILSEDIILGYNCTLCSCQFFNESAKIDHLKGRRHKFQYLSQVCQPMKRKVKTRDKPRPNKKLKLETMERGTINMSDTNVFQSSISGDMQQNHPIIMKPKLRINSPNDSFLSDILNKTKPKDDILEDLDHMNTTVQRALKLISNDKNALFNHVSKKPLENETSNSLKGIIEVGLWKKLLIDTDRHIDLVLLCDSWPSETLLRLVAEALPEKLKYVAPDDEYSIKTVVSEACIIVDSQPQPSTNIRVRILLTSPVTKSQPTKQDDQDDNILLNQVPCLLGLAEIRRKNWFVKCLSDNNLAIDIVKLMRVLSLGSDILNKLDLWTLQVLVERVIISCPIDEYRSIYNAFRRLFEALAGGILLPLGIGIVDPCEEQPVSISKDYNPQRTEDLTREAQRILGLLAFGKIHSIFQPRETVVDSFINSYNQPDEPFG